MEKKMGEQVIYPKDLLFAALYRWKQAVVLGLALAVLLGGFQITRGMKNGEVSQEAAAAYEESMEAYREEAELLQQAVDYWKRELESHRTYLQESVLMSLDPNAHYRGTVRLYVSTDYQVQPDKTFQTPDKAGYLTAAYVTKLDQDTVVTALAEAAGLSWRLFRELYTVTAEPASNTVIVQILHGDQAALDSLLSVLEEQLGQIQQELTAVGAHRLVILEKGSNLVAQEEVAETIRGQMQTLSTLKEQLAEAETAQGALTPPAEPAVAGFSVKKAVIFGILGFVAGFGLVAVCAWFVHMESDKLYSARLLSLRTGVKILGTLKVTRFGAIDRQLRKWEGRDTADTAEKAALLACDICNRCQGKVLLTGTGSPEDRAALAQSMTEAGIQVTDPGSLLTTPAAVEALKAADAVVLAEKCGKALYTETFAQIQTIADYGKTLLGCVVLDG